MHFSTLLNTVALFSTTGWAGYTLQDDYFGNGDFFSNFAFFDGADPTQGFVEYSGRIDSLISSSGSNAKMMVSTEQNTPNGRPSIRITSNKSYQSGLVVLELDHMPGGQCGTWPAFWMVGPNWPSQGEIDIIEGVNDQTSNKMTLHTGSSCSIGSSKMTGSIDTSNCDVSSGDNTGCGITAPESTTYGTGFNANGGGTYATEWTGSSISVYFWPHGSAPADISGGSPNPAGWGEPLAHFSGGCDISSSFSNQQIVFDTTFCGQWAGEDSVWTSSGCSAKANTCNDYVANNGDAFKDAFWSINGLRVYQSDGSPSEPSGAPAPSHAPSSQPIAQPSGQPSPSPSGWASAPPPAQSGGHGHGHGHGHQSHSTTFATYTQPPAAPSGAPQQSSPPEWNPSPTSGGGGGWSPWQTQGGSSPWQSGWNQKNADGQADVGQPADTVQNQAVQTDAAGASTLGEHADGGAWSVGMPVQNTRRHRHLQRHKHVHGAKRL